MRAHGTVNQVPMADASDHLCWVYGEDDGAFDAAVREFLAGGVARGERLLCVGERVIQSLQGGDSVLGDADALIADGVLGTLTLAEAYAATGIFTPEAQLGFYEAATRIAIADGYQGLRVVADVSGLAVDPGTRDVLIRWEHLADDFMASGSGMSAMCTYRHDLPQNAIVEATAVHPLVHAPGGRPPFQVFFDDHRVALTGYIDSFNADRLARVLASSPVAAEGAVLDLGQVEFVDVAGSRAIARWAQDLNARSLPLEVRGASPLLQRMWRILGLAETAPVRFAGTAA